MAGFWQLELTESRGGSYLASGIWTRVSPRSRSLQRKLSPYSTEDVTAMYLINREYGHEIAISGNSILNGISGLRIYSLR